jgi:ribosomal protein S18 acetylase RimI-like enzyme
MALPQWRPDLAKRDGANYDATPLPPLLSLHRAAAMPIRPYVEADREGVLRLWDEVFEYTSPHNSGAESIRRKVAFGDGLFYVATYRGRVVGTIMLGWDGHRGWIYSLAVAAEYRRRGIGTQLVEHGVRILTRLGAPKINLQVVGKNRGVVKFYERLGFEVEDRINMGRRVVGS